MTDTYTCPVEGCEYSGVLNSVASHYSGKKPDTAHEGGFEKARLLLEEQGPDGTVEDSEPTEQGSEAAESDGSSDGGDNPTMDTSRSDGAESAESDPESDGETFTLPCECESFPVDDAPEPPFHVTCDTCDRTYRITEGDE